MPDLRYPAFVFHKNTMTVPVCFIYSSKPVYI